MSKGYITIPNAETNNTILDAFDVEFAYFGGLDWTSLDLTYYIAGALPQNWTQIPTYATFAGGDIHASNYTITSHGTWTDVTTSVYFAGNFSMERAGSSIKWSADINGQNYDRDYFSAGKAIICLWHFKDKSVEGRRWTPWKLCYIGQIISSDVGDNYKKGKEWKAELTGMNASLSRRDAPRVVVGSLDLIPDANISVSSTLTEPGLEANTGEFIGVVADVEAENIQDDSLNSVWISNGFPEIQPEEVQQDTVFTINEVFVWPVVGYSPETAWWIELFYAGDPDNPDTTKTINTHSYWLVDSRGAAVWLGENSISTGQYCIICSNRAVYERMTGNVLSPAFIIEAGSSHVKDIRTGNITQELGDPMQMILNPDRDWIQLNSYRSGKFNWNDGAWDDEGVPGLTAGAGNTDMVCWSKGAWAPVNNNGEAIQGWTGNAVDVSAIAVGNSIRRILPGLDTTNTAADWKIETAATPGGHPAGSTLEWIYVDLDTYTSALSTDVSVGTTTWNIIDTTGWFESGQGICETDVFHYTGRTGSTLTGVTGFTSNHVKGAAVFPFEDGITQFGRPIKEITIERKQGVPTIECVHVYFLKASLGNASSGRKPGTGYEEADEDWQDDYDADFIQITNIGRLLSEWATEDGETIAEESEQRLSVITIPLGDDTKSYRRVRGFLVQIHRMEDNGRAKVNRMTAKLDQMSIDYSTFGDLDGARSSDMARYLIVDIFGTSGFMTTNYTYFVDHTNPPTGNCSTHAIAISPYTDVLDSLANNTGCIVLYDVDGSIKWLQDPWWPVGQRQSAPYYTFDKDSIRGNINIARRREEVDAVAVTASNSDGSDSWRIVHPPGGDKAGNQVKELSDFVVPNFTTAKFLAEAMWWKETHRTDASWIVKGIGEWCMPGQWVSLAWDWDGDGDTYDIIESDNPNTIWDRSHWLIEKVSRRWSIDDNHNKSFETELELRRYFK